MDHKHHWHVFDQTALDSFCYWFCCCHCMSVRWMYRDVFWGARK